MTVKPTDTRPYLRAPLKQAQTEHKANMLAALQLDKLPKSLCKRVLTAATNQGFSDKHWYTRTNIAILLNSSVAILTNLIKESKDGRTLTRLTNAWRDWLTDNAQ